MGDENLVNSVPKSKIFSFAEWNLKDTKIKLEPQLSE